MKYNVQLNNGNEAFGVTDKTITATDPADTTPTDPADPTGNQGNNPNPGSGDDGMS